MRCVAHASRRLLRSLLKWRDWDGLPGGGEAIAIASCTNTSARLATLHWPPGSSADQHDRATRQGGPNCVLVQQTGGNLFFRTGALDAAAGTISWAAEKKLGAGSAIAVAMIDDAICLEAHIDQGQLYTNIGWLRGDGGIDWDTPQSFGAAGAVAIGGSRDKLCVELHSGVGPDADKLFCTLGSIDLLHPKVKWGNTIGVGTGSHGSVAISAGGRCIVTFASNGTVYGRSGLVDVKAGNIEWFPVVELGKGAATAISIDDLGRCAEVHVDEKTAVCILGRH